MCMQPITPVPVVTQLKEDVVPKTAQNFVQLAKKAPGQGFKGSRFHRVIPNFMCQVLACRCYSMRSGCVSYEARLRAAGV